MPDPRPTPPPSVPEAAIRGVLKSQYRAALAMLRTAIESCPDDLWDDPRPANRFWQVAYHALFFTHLYLARDEASFQPWTGHRSRCQHPDAIPGPVDPASDLPLLPEPYSREQVLDYQAHCERVLDAAVDDLELHRTESGFSWYPISKLEHQLVNLRHVQHHAGQLADRVRAAAGVGVPWAGARREGPSTRR